MCKFLITVALCALAVALVAAAPSAFVYNALPEYSAYSAYPAYPAAASGYEYQHTVQTPDYITHSSVSAPLNGVASVAPAVVRAALSDPLAYALLG